MSKRVTLDLSSFQKLLEAAWVLQCEQDRVVHRARAATGDASIRWEPTAPASEWAEPVLEGAVVADQCAPVLASDIPLPPPTAVGRNVDVVGSLALAPVPQAIPQPTPVPFLGSENLKKPVSRHGGIIGAIHAQHVSDIPEARVPSARPRLVLVIPKRTPSDLRAFVGPAVVLAVLLVFLFCEIAAHQLRVTPVKAAPESATTADIAVPAVSISHNDEPATVTSHLQVTDARTETALQNLSPYEIRNLRRQAQFGDDPAALTLGMAYETGHGVRQSCSEAARWISIAAADGLAAAQYNLSLRYRDGDGVPSDPQQAQKWISAAADQGYPPANVARLQ